MPYTRRSLGAAFFALGTTTAIAQFGPLGHAPKQYDQVVMPVDSGMACPSMSTVIVALRHIRNNQLTAAQMWTDSHEDSCPSFAAGTTVVISEIKTIEDPLLTLMCLRPVDKMSCRWTLPPKEMFR